MSWGSVDAFFAMGGYGLYVWGSYGVTALAIVVELIAIAGRRRRTQAAVARRVEELDR